MSKLSDSKVKSLKTDKKQERFYDGGGLYIEVSNTGKKHWRYKFRIAGKENVYSIGSYPNVSLRNARIAHQEAKALVEQGINPTIIKNTRKFQNEYSSHNSLEAIGNEWFAIKISTKSDSHKVRTERYLRQDIYPIFGKRQIDDIAVLEFSNLFKKIQDEVSPDKAKRIRQTLVSIYAYAVSAGYCQINPIISITEIFKKHKVKHRTAITSPEELGKFLLDAEETTATLVTKTALLLTPILFQRPGNIRAMEWSEIDWINEMWNIPNEKMKVEKDGFSTDHSVPLPKQAIDLLRNIHPYTGNGQYVFPSARGKTRCLSENGVRTAMRDMGWSNEQVTPHGFRATARTLLDEVLKERVDLIEHQLAHAVKDPTGRAYNRTTFLEERKVMMQRWADYLDQLKEEARARRQSN